MVVKIQKRTIIVMLLLVLAIAAALIFIKVSHRQKATSGPIKTLDSKSAASNSANTGTATSQSSSDKSSTGGAASGQPNSSGTLVAPYGTLVSNHRPGQNGSTLTELSQCSTSPGAKCYIKFTQGDIVKTLPERTTDASGSVSWEWSIDGAGLSSGKWQITAVATLDKQSKSTTDQLLLEVQ